MRLMGTPQEAGASNVDDIMQYLIRASQQPSGSILPGAAAVGAYNQQNTNDDPHGSIMDGVMGMFQ
jgi:hypothetical protein